jgi:hypothetical protein
LNNFDLIAVGAGNVGTRKDANPFEARTALAGLIEPPDPHSIRRRRGLYPQRENISIPLPFRGLPMSDGGLQPWNLLSGRSVGLVRSEVARDWGEMPRRALASHSHMLPSKRFPDSVAQKPRRSGEAKRHFVLVDGLANPSKGSLAIVAGPKLRPNRHFDSHSRSRSLL